MTYRECYEKGCLALQTAGIEEATLDARLLLEAVCGTNRNDLLVHGEQSVTPEAEEKYLGWIGQRAEHIPLQQLTGEQDFMGLTFAVNEHVLIPRQDTEILVEEVLKDHLDEYKEDCSTAQIEDDSRIPEKEICDKMLRALSKLQRNHHYNADSSEDTMNDYIRDILGESYFMKDQTRQGDSENGDEAGEVDIQLCYDGLPVVMIEGIKVSSLERERLDSHMNKVLTKYDPNGCPYTFLIVYTTAKNFDLGYKNIFNHFDKYSYPFPRECSLLDVETGYGELKHAQIILNRNGQKIRVHIWAAHIV